jgi:hypothetical protein
MATLLGVLVETGGRDDWPDDVEILRHTSESFVWVEIPATLATVADVEGREAFAAALSARFGGRAWSVLVQTTATAQDIVAFDAGEPIRTIRAVEFQWRFEGEPGDWEQAYFFGDAEEACPSFFIGETDAELARFRSAPPEELADEDLMMPHPDGVERLLAAHGVSWSSPGARWVPPSQARFRRWLWLGIGATLVFWVSAFLLGRYG